MQGMKVYRRTNKKATALLVVMALGVAGTIVLSGTLKWTSHNAMQINRNIAYQNAVLAAEAATEKALSMLITDFAKEGAGTVGGRMNEYKKRIPRPDEHPQWGRYKFKNGRGSEGEILVTQVQPWTQGVVLQSQYRMLKGYSSIFRIRANAYDVLNDTEAAVYQDVQLALVPVFQFAVFYNLDLEVFPGANMDMRGPVHCNRNIYAGSEPQATLTFYDLVTMVGSLYNTRKWGTPMKAPVFNGRPSPGYQLNVSSLNLPIGTNNTPEAVREVVEPPQGSENLNSLMAQQRFYNICDVVVEVYTNDVVIKGGKLSPGSAATIPWQYASNWISTNKTFYDQREKKTVVLTEIDIGKFNDWATNNNPIANSVRVAQGRYINSLYVIDKRPRTAAQLPAVRLVNGAVLPPSGLTVVTPNPLYVKGNYNAYGASVGSTNTANTKPAALISDAITILSGSWDDSRSSSSISTRVASDTTVNAAIMAGIVETVGSDYSGGLENLPRFLENWSGKVFTYNGSMVVMYPSQYATNKWAGTGGVYNPPTRRWSFDLNFTDPSKLPPLTPQVRAVVRVKWATIAPDES